MSVKKPNKQMLGTKTPVPSGTQMLYGKEVENAIKERYKDKELTESECQPMLQESSTIDK